MTVRCLAVKLAQDRAIKGQETLHLAQQKLVPGFPLNVAKLDTVQDLILGLLEHLRVMSEEVGRQALRLDSNLQDPMGVLLNKEPIVQKGEA